MILRRLLLACLVLLSANFAFGHYYAGYEWRVTTTPLVPTWRPVDAFEVQAKCRYGREGWFNACAVRDTRGGVCTIYASQSEEQTPMWLRWHEYLHCAGWDHD